jgi:hypothetical protein
MRLIYLIGEPATGKSTVLRAFLQEYPPQAAWQFGKLRGLTCANGLYVLGIYDGRPFGGTDRLSMAVQPDAVQFLSWAGQQAKPIVIIGEGDRLANRKFFSAAEAVGQVNVLYLYADPATLQARHASRADTQDAQWLLGRRTKTLRLAERCDVERFQHETPQDTIRVVARLRELSNGSLGTTTG